MSYIAMIIVLGGLSMLLPNFIEGAGNRMFSTVQAISLSVLIVILYGFFLAFQTKNYSHLYVQPKAGSMEIPFKDRKLFSVNNPDGVTGEAPKNKRVMLIRTIVLLAMILPIVLLSHNMATVVDFGIEAADLPIQLGVSL